MDKLNIQEVGRSLLKTAQQNYLRFGLILSHNEKKYRRIAIKKGQERIDFKPINVQVENITFHICPYSLNKQDYKKYGSNFCLLASFKYRKKDMFCMISDYGTNIQMYTKHFFERYIERHLKDDSEVNINLVRKYFKETEYVCHIESVDREGYDNSIFGGTNIGTCCGYKVCDNVYVFNTYIDVETLKKGDKRRVYDESQPLIQPIGMDAIGNRIFPGTLLEIAFSEAANNDGEVA